MVLMAVGTTLFLLPALINGYPLVYSDTSTYIASGFTLDMPMDRPIMYGLFLRFVSLNGFTLWTVVVVQGLLLSMVLYRLYTLLSATIEAQWKVPGYLFMVILSALSGAAWATSHLMPDIFTSIMVLSMLLILIQDRTSHSSIGLYLLFGVSVSMHFSHVPISLTLLVVIIVIWIFNHRRGEDHFGLRVVVILTAITLLAFTSMLPAYSKSKHVFLMGAFVEQGIIGEYLHDNCAEKAYALCRYQDSLPRYSWEFIWEPTSPLYKLGGWKETREEFNEIIGDTFKSPKYLWIHFKTSIRETFHQLIRFQTVDPFGVAPNSEQLRSRIFQYIPPDGVRYDSSIQSRTNLLVLAWLNPVQKVLIFLSLAVFLIYFLMKQRWKFEHSRITLLILLSGILLNALITGTFANAIDRMGNKMIWLVPMMAAVILTNTIRNHFKA